MTPAAARKRERRGWRKAKGIAPARDRKYLAWIRTLPCVVCYLDYWLDVILEPSDEEAWATLMFFPTTQWGSTWQKSPTEAAHMGIRGLGQKCSDYSTLPLCAHEHHREGPESAHKLGKQFCGHHGFNQDALIAALRCRWKEGK